MATRAVVDRLAVGLMAITASNRTAHVRSRAMRIVGFAQIGRSFLELFGSQIMAALSEAKLRLILKAASFNQIFQRARFENRIAIRIDALNGIRTGDPVYTLGYLLAKLGYVTIEASDGFAS